MNVIGANTISLSNHKPIPIHIRLIILPAIQARNPQELQNLREIGRPITRDSVPTRPSREPLDLTSICASTDDIIEGFVATLVKPWIEETESFLAGVDEGVIYEGDYCCCGGSGGAGAVDGDDAGVPDN